MCGIAGIFGKNWQIRQLEAMQFVQRHRGPDDRGIYVDPTQLCGLAHNRLSIIDLSADGRQPMPSADKNYRIVFNGEIYNYLELKRELQADYEFQTKTDTEVLLAAYQKWGTDALNHLIGMFAFIIWDEKEKKVFAARDRFGVKPLYYHLKNDETLFLASEIKALHAAGIAREPNEKIWADYLTYGLINHSQETFWRNIYALPAGHFLTRENGETKISSWYDLAEKIGDDFDCRAESIVQDEYLALMKNSVKMRFRADVPVGINLSGGLDSSTLLGLVHTLENAESSVTAYTFATGDERYDELPWVRELLAKTEHPLIVSMLKPEYVPKLAASVQKYQDEPFGGVPTLAYAQIFEDARRNGTKVLLDGNGLDEQWAGYSYYQNLTNSDKPNIVQGTSGKAVRAECLQAEFRSLAKDSEFPRVFSDKLRNLQYRDVYRTKIPRAMRYNDRISMRASTELREPFLDHRLFELAFRQPARRKISKGIHKRMLREIVGKLLPTAITEAPKRALQTPQREWLREELFDWADALINVTLNKFGGIWFDKKSVLEEWKKYCKGESDNSFYVWQWINVGLMNEISSQTERNIELYSYQSAVAR